MLLVLNALSEDGGGNSDIQSKRAAKKLEIHGSGSGNAFPVQMIHEELKEGELWIRYCYDGGKLTRDGRLVRLLLGSADVHNGLIQATLVLDQLQREGVALDRVAPHAFDPLLGSWAPLLPSTNLSIFHEGPPRVDVKLLRTSLSREVPAHKAADARFTIGIVGAKTEKNLGTLWRTGFQLGADSVFVIGNCPLRYGLRVVSSFGQCVWYSVFCCPSLTPTRPSVQASASVLRARRNARTRCCA